MKNITTRLAILTWLRKPAPKKSFLIMLSILSIMSLLFLSCGRGGASSNNPVSPPPQFSNPSIAGDGSVSMETSPDNSIYTPLSSGDPVPDGTTHIKFIATPKTAGPAYSRFDKFTDLPTPEPSVTIAANGTASVVLTLAEALAKSPKAEFVKQHKIEVKPNVNLNNWEVKSDKTYAMTAGEQPTTSPLSPIGSGQVVFIDAGTSLSLSAVSTTSPQIHRVKEFVINGSAHSPTWSGTTATKTGYMPNTNCEIGVNDVKQHTVVIKSTETAKRYIFLNGTYSTTAGGQPTTGIVDSSGAADKTYYFDEGNVTLSHNATILHDVAITGATLGNNNLTLGTTINATITLNTDKMIDLAPGTTVYKLPSGWFSPNDRFTSDGGNTFDLNTQFKIEKYADTTKLPTITVVSPNFATLSPSSYGAHITGARITYTLEDKILGGKDYVKIIIIVLPDGKIGSVEFFAEKDNDDSGSAYLVKQ